MATKEDVQKLIDFCEALDGKFSKLQQSFDEMTGGDDPPCSSNNNNNNPVDADHQQLRQERGDLRRLVGLATHYEVPSTTSSAIERRLSLIEWRRVYEVPLGAGRNKHEAETLFDLIQTAMGDPFTEKDRDVVSKALLRCEVLLVMEKNGPDYAGAFSQQLNSGATFSAAHNAGLQASSGRPKVQERPPERPQKKRKATTSTTSSGEKA